MLCICSGTCWSLGHALLIMGILTSMLPRWWVNYPRARVSLQGAAHKYVSTDVLFISHVYRMWHRIFHYIARCVPHTLWLRVILLMTREQMQTECFWKRHLDYKLINGETEQASLLWDIWGDLQTVNHPRASSCWTKTEKVFHSYCFRGHPFKCFSSESADLCSLFRCCC